MFAGEALTKDRCRKSNLHTTKSADVKGGGNIVVISCSVRDSSPRVSIDGEFVAALIPRNLCKPGAVALDNHLHNVVTSVYSPELLHLASTIIWEVSINCHWTRVVHRNEAL